MNARSGKSKQKQEVAGRPVSPDGTGRLTSLRQGRCRRRAERRNALASVPQSHYTDDSGEGAALGAVPMTTSTLRFEGTVAEKGFFAVRLKVLRAQAGLSQPELAERAGMPLPTLRGFEQGRREPNYRTLVKLGRGLGVPLSAFEPPEEP